MDERIKELIRRVVSSEGMELVHVELKTGKDSFLRILIDKPGGVTLDDCQNISEQVGAMLDVEDPIPHHYVLEVASPGLDRPLFTEADFKKFLGRDVKIKTKSAIYDRTNFTGRIAQVENGIISIAEGPKRFDVPLEHIQKANLKLAL